MMDVKVKKRNNSKKNDISLFMANQNEMEGSKVVSDLRMSRHVLRENEIDNEAEIENPFVNNQRDLRVFKIGIMCKVIEPEHGTKNLKLNYQSSEFWFVKGHDHSVKLQMNSAIDSYRQAIKLNPKCVEAMHNLGCLYESQ